LKTGSSDRWVTSLTAAGSAAVDQRLPSSDFDIAVVVPPLHLFSFEPARWREYQGRLAGSLQTDFEIHPGLVVAESPRFAYDLLRELEVTGGDKNDFDFLKKLLRDDLA
jgi:predicted nucleotidyltransferase